MSKYKDNINSLIREYIKKQLTGNLGEIVEEDDKIVCYVKKEKCKKKDNQYTINCPGTNAKNIEIVEKYNLNKPICYIFKDLEFRGEQVCIFNPYHCDIVIKNCVFNYGLNISSNGKVILDNTFIQTIDSLSIGAKQIILKSMNIKNYFRGIKLKISLYAGEQIQISDSYIGRQKEQTDICLSSSWAICLDGTKLCGDNITCETNNFKATKSSIEAQDNVYMSLGSCDSINITSPKIILNNNDIEVENNQALISTNPLMIKRFELLWLLKQIKDKCNQTNQCLVSNYNNQLNNESISKTLILMKK